MNRSCFLILLCALSIPAGASAQCTMPHGASDAEMGVIVFNKAHRVMQYCNGDDWIGLWGGGGGGTQRVSGEVVAFDLAACPDGWSEYLPARGRFIRGIDNGAGNDPDGTRTSGHIQVDAFRSHAHTGTTDSAGNHNHNLALGYMGANQGIGVGYGDAGTGGKTRDAGAHTHTFTTSAVGATETRPKNVALLYCRKD